LAILPTRYSVVGLVRGAWSEQK